MDRVRALAWRAVWAWSDPGPASSGASECALMRAPLCQNTATGVEPGQTAEREKLARDRALEGSSGTSCPVIAVGLSSSGARGRKESAAMALTAHTE
jgi:hypothetical protein